MPGRKLFVGFLDVLLNGHGHGRSFRHRSHDINLEVGIADSLCGSRPEGSNTGIVLLEIGEILEKGSNTRWTEKYQHIVLHLGQIRQIAAYRAVQNSLGMIDSVIAECIGNFLLVDVAAGKQELFFLVLFQDVDQIVNGRLAVKDFTFPVNDIFLKIEGSGFGNAEILELVQIGDPHLIADPEKMISSMTAGQYHSSEIADIDSVLAKLLSRYPFDVNEFPEIYLQVKLPGQLVIR